MVAAACGSNPADTGLRAPAAAADAALDAADAELDLSVTGDGDSASTATDSSITTTSTTTTVPPTTTVPGIVVNEYLLGINECFNCIDDLVSGRARVITTKVRCEDPHQFQIFSKLDYPAQGPSRYPGDDIMEDFALASCYQQFAAWADSVYEVSDLEIGAFTPTVDNFEPPTSYRGIQCYVTRTDSEPLIGTARGQGL